MFGLLLNLLVLGGLIALVVVGIRRAGGAGSADSGGHGLRRFFQYALLYGLLVVSANGLAGLASRLTEGADLVRADEAQLARSLAFTVIGLPVYAGLAVWSRRRLQADDSERRSFGWVMYATLASLTALIVGMTALHDVLLWAFGVDGYQSGSLPNFVVWALVWVVHREIDADLTPAPSRLPHLLLGSLTGLLATAFGTGGLLKVSFEALFGTGTRLAETSSPFFGPLASLLVGVPVWYLYWVRGAGRAERTQLWLGYVLVVGVAGGLITAITAATTAIHDVLVWFIGDPVSESAARHFASLAGSGAAAVVGLVVWWYHRTVVAATGAGRTEPGRVYEYSMAAIGLLAATSGVTTILVALIESIAGAERVVTGSSAINTLLLALTLLAVGAPLWVVYWRRIQAAVASDPDVEYGSPTRRIYLFAIFGVGGVAAVISLITAVFIVFEDFFEGSVGAETIRGVRFAVAILFTTGLLAAYHWSVYRRDREAAPDQPVRPRFVLLIGPRDDDLAREVARTIDAKVEVWVRTDDEIPGWELGDVLGAIAGLEGKAVVVLAEPEGVRAFPVQHG